MDNPKNDRGRNDRQVPPLILAFRDAFDKGDAREKVDERERGERVIASRRSVSRAPITEGALRALVNSDLVELLNTTNLDSAESLDAVPYIRKSILNYGFPDIAWRTAEEHGVAAISKEIEVAVADFEPRLARGSVKARREASPDGDNLRLRFHVDAELRMQPSNVQMEFVAEIEKSSGKIKIDRL